MAARAVGHSRGQEQRLEDSPLVWQAATSLLWLHTSRLYVANTSSCPGVCVRGGQHVAFLAFSARMSQTSRTWVELPALSLFPNHLQVCGPQGSALQRVCAPGSQDTLSPKLLPKESDPSSSISAEISPPHPPPNEAFPDSSSHL